MWTDVPKHSFGCAALRLVLSSRLNEPPINLTGKGNLYIYHQHLRPTLTNCIIGYKANDRCLQVAPPTTRVSSCT